VGGSWVREIPPPETHERLVSLIVDGAGTPTTNGHDSGTGPSEHGPQQRIS